MRFLCVVLMSMALCAHVFAYDSSSDSSNNYNNPYSSNSDTNNTTNSTNNSTNNSNQGLLQDMNKKTSKGLKVFDKLLQDDGQSKQDFFADVGQNPTADQFEGGDGSGGPVENPFAKILGNDAQGNQ
ncbi:MULTISPECIES: hypothetical protein [Cysteiniphilum]|uniref:Uncharacterized protein n=1 Tax=Cysteiniphilum litorale TaxID=2056700 RepID=A0A8J2Z4M4_9GAMM|nr:MULTISPECIES: hypothetical protein [Cysteiniphilum]GGF99678.1 hypothetical protein GCM10010995_16240 [Cysteiniphilum litorale]